MEKIKSFFKKKPVLIAAALAAVVTIFFLLMRGRSSGGVTQLTPKTTTSGSASSNQNDTGSILAAVKDMFTSFKQANDQQIADLQQNQKDQASNLSGLVSSLAQQIKQTGWAGGGGTASVNPTPTPSMPSWGLNTNTPSPVNIPPANAWQHDSATDPAAISYGASQFMQTARNAIDNASQNYFANAGDSSQQDYYHNQADSVRQGVMDYFSGQDGYSVNTQDSGGGYSNVVVTAPDGSTQTF